MNERFEPLNAAAQSQVLNRIHNVLLDIGDLLVKRSEIDVKVASLIVDLKQGVAMVNNSVVANDNAQQALKAQVKEVETTLDHLEGALNGELKADESRV